MAFTSPDFIRGGNVIDETRPSSSGNGKVIIPPAFAPIDCPLPSVVFGPIATMFDGALFSSGFERFAPCETWAGALSRDSGRWGHVPAETWVGL